MRDQSTMNYNVENCGALIKYQRRRYHDDRAQTVAKKEEQSCTRPLEVVEVDNEVEELIKIEKEHLCWKPSHRRKEDLCELIEIDEEEFYHKKKGRHTNVDRGDHEIRKCAVVPIDNEQLHLSLALARAGLVLVGDKNKCKRVREKNSVVKEEEEPIPRSKRVKKCMSECTNEAQLVERRSQSDEHAARAREVVMVKEEHEAKVKIENENQDVRAMNNSMKIELMDVAKQEDGRLSSKKAAAVKDEPYDCTKPFLEREEVQSRIRRFKKTAAVKDEPDDGTTGSADVEILDIGALVERGISCPFASSKKFHKSMVEDESLEGPSATDDFREDVLRVLRKPFDKQEYRKHQEEIKVGFYLDHHPDVRRKLTKYRYKPEKCLIILRGFFYWLQNLTREGAFHPWRDEQCLAVELPAS